MTDNRAQINILNKLITDNDTFLLTSHQDPDGDSIGSLIGLNNYLKRLGKKTMVYSQGIIPSKYVFLDSEGVIKSEAPKTSSDFPVAIILECPRFERIGFVKNLIGPQTLIVNIDHHEDNEMYGRVNIVDKDACAVGQILFDIFNSAGGSFDADVAGPLYAALISDTGCFKFSNTTSRCLNTAAVLVEKGARPKSIAENIFSSFTAATLKMVGYVLQNMRLYADGKICVFKLAKNDPAKFGASMENSEGLIDYSMMIKGVEVGVLLKEVDSKTVKVSLRSRDGIDIGSFAGKRGGGGHLNASGFTLAENLDSAEPTVVIALSEYLNV
ncbi:MAG: bifunctional oligoribonuclease/PAP phosphatase NrnA [candidate division Zixibacteria bacterium]|nr:bifunctional oligoribonuclease/PAP phosphatase NrnA [candidate division Zixibacteria bacterium]